MVQGFAMKICSIDGCGQALYARGWCEMHYARWHRKGSTDKFENTQPTRDEILARFEAKVEKTDTCWLWTGCINSSGYGTISVRGKCHMSHRLSWDLFKSKKIGKQFVLHMCDVRNCVNPSHLFSGTQNENIADMIKKGRQRTGRLAGIKHGMSKISEDDVRTIRASKQTAPVLAKQFGISRSNVGMIRTGKTWRHLP